MRRPALDGDLAAMRAAALDGGRKALADIAWAVEWAIIVAAVFIAAAGWLA